jgi:hypothetical protein
MSTAQTNPAPHTQTNVGTSASAPARAAATAGSRDIRLDFFRGIAMFIILIAHIPFNRLSNYIPARYGWSDAAEIFVFCSGMASALAFGKVFVTRGWGMGLARVAYRCWQVYWAHVCLFLAVAATKAAIDLSGVWQAYGSFDKNFVDSMGITRFFDQTQEALIGLLTLTYVPNYFDILPMYLVILGMIPLVMAAARVHPWLAMGGCVAVWAVAQTGALDLPAEPWGDRPWFFNPFGWQLVFFTGFAFMRGWLPKPPVTTGLIALAAVFLIVSVPFGRWQIWTQVPWIESWRDANTILFAKTEEGILRYLHFLALAYLAWAAAGPGGARLMTGGHGALARLWDGARGVILKVGQQSLAVFIFSMWAAQMLGFALDFTAERGWGPTLAVNLAGMAMVVGVAYLAAWFKSAPWRGR